MCTTILLGAIYTYDQLSERQQHKFPLLASRLFQDKAAFNDVNFQPLRSQVKSYLANTHVDHSFYFEYLFTGSTIRDGDSNQLVGASLMKIPIVMDLYKAVEENKVSLDKQVTVPDNIINSNDSQYGNVSHLKSGDKIKLGDAAKIALSESDNTAAYTIFNATQGMLPSQDQSLNNLDIETQSGDSSKGPLVLISSRSYSSILQCLYFSCFLNEKDSQSILNYLTMDSTDNTRIRAGVPNNVQVARKLGSFGNITQSDCGIVYVPNKDYLLCVLMNENGQSADHHIKDLSAMVYKYVNGLN